MRRGVVLAQFMVYMAVAAVALTILVPLIIAVDRAAGAIFRAREDLESAGIFLEDFKDDVRGARRVRADGDVLLLTSRDGEEVLYRFLDGAVSRVAGEEARDYPGALEELRFDVRGALVTVDLELRRDPAGRLRPRLRSEVFARAAEEPR